MTDYLALAQARAPQPEDQEQENPYLPLAREQQNLQQNRVRTVLESAFKDNPDTAAERMRIAQQSGVPLRIVERNLDELRIKEQARMVDLARMAQESPVLYRQLTDPTFTTTSVDDLDTLKNIERSIGRGVAYVMGADGKGGLPKDVAGAATTIGLGATVGIGKMAFDTAAVLNDLIGWEAGAAGARASAKRAGDSMRELGFEGGTSTRDAVKSGLQSAGTNLAILPLGLARGLYSSASQAASTVAGIMATGVGADAFNRAKDQGKNTLQAGMYAIPEATFEYVFERIPASKLFGDIAANTGLLKTLGKQAVSEGWTEQVTTLAQDFNEWMNLNPDKTLGEFIQERPEAAYQTFIATLVGVGVQTTTIKSIDKIVQKASDRQLQFEQDAFNERLKLAGQSMLRMRSPEQFRNHIQQVVEANPESKAEVFIDAEVLNQMPPELLEQLPESVREQIPAALETNSVVSIPMADVLTIAPGTPLEQALNDNVKMTPDAPSKIEAQTYSDMLAKDAQRVLEQAQDQATWQQSADNVKTNLLGQLNTAGRFTPEVNEAYATLVRDFYATMAGRQGITPEEMYQRYPLRIAAQGMGGQQLDQAKAMRAEPTGGISPITRKPIFELYDEQGGRIGLTHSYDTADEAVARFNAPKPAAPATPTYTLPERELPKRSNWKQVKGEKFTALDEDDDYLYHVTAAPNAAVIRSDGLAPNSDRMFGASYADYSSGKVFLTERSGVSFWQARVGDQLFSNYDNPPAVVVMRIPKSKITAKLTPDDTGSKDARARAYFATETLAQSAPFNGTEQATTPIGDATEVEVDGKMRPALNSNGQPIHWSVEGVRNFWRWFGDSRVVDKTGRPVPVFHGSTADIEAFDPTQANDRMYSGGTENTVFFTDNADVAASYAGRRTSMTGLDATFRDGGNVTPVYLKISKPLKANAKGENWRDVPYKGEFYSTAELTEVAKSEKKDGMVVSKVIDHRDSGITGDKTKKPSTTYAVFNPTQIKSATGNSGAFSGQDANILRQTAFHGTPHRGIDKFSTDKIGTGEGAQAYGWGLYFASRREVAEWYRRSLSRGVPVVKINGRAVTGTVFNSVANRLNDSLDNITVAEVRAEIERTLAEAKVSTDLLQKARAKELTAALKKLDGAKSFEVIQGDNPGQLYEVDIPEDDTMLLWDRPLSEQPEAVQRAARQLYRFDDGKKTGQQLYKEISREAEQEKAKRGRGDQVASETLADVGVKGIKYLDGTSRNAGDGSYNYVIFSGDDVAIQNQFYQGEQARGTYSPDQLLITLNANADLSTFLHESGHFFLEVMADLASQPNAPADIQDDMGKLLKWFGIKGDEQVGGPDAGGSSELAQNPTDQERLDAEALAVSRGANADSVKTMSDDELRRELFRLSRPVRKEPAAKTKTLKALSKRAGGATAEQLDEQFGITVADDGLVQIDKLTEENAKVIGDLPIAFYHHTSTALLPAIQQEGLKVGKQTNFFNTQAGVYVTLIQAGVPVTTYSSRAAKVHGGEPTTLRLKRRISDVIPDPDDADLAWAQGKQFITPRVPASDLAPLSDEFAQDGNLPTDGTQPAGRTPLEVWNAMTLDQKRVHHERFAESFEQYLLEGKAPSQELQPLFRKFRAWMVNVYKSLTHFMRGRDLKLSDEVRQVFDRMLAADEAIRQQEEASGLLPDFDATNEAIEKLQARSLRDLKRTVNARSRALKALQKEAAMLRKGVEDEVRAEVEAMPVYQAQDAIAKIKGEPTDVEMETIAEATGFTSASEMLTALATAGTKASTIEGMTDQRMLENFGELATPAAIEEAANDAVHNEARAKSLATELKAQADMLNTREQTGTASNGRAITVNALAKAAKEFGANIAARRRVKDLKRAAQQHRAAEAKAGKRWQEATAAGKTQDAVQAKRDQVLNNATVKALNEAQAEVKKIREFFARVTKDGNEKLVDKGRDPDVVNAMRAILAAYDVAPRLEKGALEYMEAVAKNDPTMYAALQPSVQGAMNNAKPLAEMTVEELRGLSDEMRSMWYLAKRSRQSEIDGNLLDREALADDLVARMTEIGIPDTIPGERGSITTSEEAGIKLQFAKSILSRVEQWAERFDGKFGGPFLRYVFQPVKDAADRYRTARVEYRKKFTALLENIAPTLKPGPIGATELDYTFGNARDSGVAELLHAILHTGNESNKRKLLLGRNWATENADGTLDTSRWDAFITRMIDTGVIQKAHYDFAQGVWDLLEQTKPLAQKTHREVFGRYFAEVTADPFVTPFGTYKGGYVPAIVDTRIVREQEINKMLETQNEAMVNAFPSSPSGFTKSRVEYNRELLLDLRALAQHMDKVLLFAHMQGAVTDVRRLLTDKRVSYALNRIDPSAYTSMLLPWLDRAAKQVVETPVMGDRGISRFFSAARSRAGMALMMANLSNTVQQVTGFTMAAVKVKPSLMMSSLGQFVASPKQVRESVASASPYMRDRMLNEVGAMNDVVEQILIDPTLLERGQAWTQRHAYFMQSAVDNMMSPIIWTAAYNQATEQKMSHTDAVRFADGVIRQTQGSTLPEDISRFESGPAWARLFTQFVSYFNMMANTNATAVSQIANEMGLRKGAGKLLYVALAGLLAPIWVAEAIAQAFRGGPEDEDDDGYLDDWLAAVFGLGTIRGLTAQIPLVGLVAQGVVNSFNTSPADDKFSLSPAVSLIESAARSPKSVYDAIVDDGKVQKAVRDVAAAATMVTGLPFYAVARPLGYAAGVAAGDIDPTSGADAVRGVITGTASPDSKQR